MNIKSDQISAGGENEILTDLITHSSCFEGFGFLIRVHLSCFYDDSVVILFCSWLLCSVIIRDKLLKSATFYCFELFYVFLSLAYTEKKKLIYQHTEIKWPLTLSCTAKSSTSNTLFNRAEKMKNKKLNLNINYLTCILIICFQYGFMSHLKIF